MRKMYNMLLIAMGFVMVFSGAVNAQGIGINSTGAAPDSSAALDVNSTNKGLLIPRMTTVQRNLITSPASSLLIFNTTDNCYESYNGSLWQSVICLCTAAPSTPGSITGSVTPCIGANSVIYSIVPVSGANSYAWTAPSDATITAGQGTTSVTVNFGSSPGNITVSASNSCGTSSASILPVSISNVPDAPGTISGNTSPCSGATGVNYSISPVNGATSYTWTAPSGAVVTAGQGTTSVLINFSSTPGNISVAASNNCGTGSASVLPITISVTPGSPGSISGPATFYNGESGVVYSISSVNGASTYTWTVPSDATITAGQGTTSITTSFFDTVSGSICVTAGNACGTSSSSCTAPLYGCYSPGLLNFSYTGAAQTFTVPCGVSSVTLSVWAAQGGNSGGGLGGYATGNLAVTPGEILYVYVGQQGSGSGSPETFGGGGNSGFYSRGSGGGASDIRVGGTNIGNRVIVAGGGGGANSDGGGGAMGGYGGGLTGGNGSDNNSFGATQNSYGTGSCCPCNAPTQGNGQDGYCGGCNGSGGGGGYYGGGACTQGGGGSGYIGGVTGGSMQSGVQTGNGKATIVW